MLVDERYESVRSAGFQVLAVNETPYSLNFQIAPGSTKQEFLSLFDAMKGKGYLPVLRRRGEDVVLSLVRAEIPAKSKRDSLLILGSLLLTALTISIDFVVRYPMIQAIESAVGTSPSFAADFATYVLGFLVIFGSHELGHKLSSMRNDVETSGPYFIPGVPGVLPTLGAVILQRGIPKNRDELIDIGISGPLVGFFTAVMLAELALFMAVQLPIEEVARIGDETGAPFVEMQPIVQLLTLIPLTSIQEGRVLFLGALGTPVWLAFTLTFVNLFPAGQLDGGHVARGALGPRGHRILTMLSVVGLILAGFWLMAVFALLTWGFRDHPGPLDDVSDLSLSTKLKVGVGLLVLVLCFTGL